MVVVPHDGFNPFDLKPRHQASHREKHGRQEGGGGGKNKTCPMMSPP